MNRATTFSFDNLNFPYEDATENLIFEVTEKDISSAIRRDPNHCVAACAVRRQYTRAYFARDTAVLLFPNSEGKLTAKRYRFSSALRKAVKDFDDEKPFATGVYKLVAPTPTQTLAAKRLRAKKPPKKKRIVRSRTVFISRGHIPASLA